LGYLAGPGATRYVGLLGCLLGVWAGWFGHLGDLLAAGVRYLGWVGLGGCIFLYIWVGGLFLLVDY